MNTQSEIPMQAEQIATSVNSFESALVSMHQGMCH